jgi:hypothetical protein
MAPETQMERSYDLKSKNVRVPPRAEDVLSRVRAARQHETVKASIPRRVYSHTIPRCAPLERLFSGPRSDGVYLDTTCQLSRVRPYPPAMPPSVVSAQIVILKKPTYTKHTTAEVCSLYMCTEL